MKSFGWISLATALAAAVFEVTLYIETGKYKLIAFGEAWYSIDSASLNTAQVVIQRYLFSWLWDPIAIFVLTLPIWPVLCLVASIILYFFGRRKKRRKFLC